MEDKMLFYFNVRSNESFDVDEEGIELPSLDAARWEAMKSAREMVAELILHNQRIDGMRFEITDDKGNLLVTVPFKDVIKFD
jgi:hypothetical protein